MSKNKPDLREIDLGFKFVDIYSATLIYINVRKACGGALGKRGVSSAFEFRKHLSKGSSKCCLDRNADVICFSGLAPRTMIKGGKIKKQFRRKPGTFECLCRMQIGIP